MGMIQTANHVLSKEGILTTFSIAKRVSLKSVKNLRKKAKKGNFNSKKFQDLLRKSIMKETQKALMDRKIPGLIFSGQNVSDEEKKKMMELTYFASVIAKKVNEKKIDKYHACYIINAIVNMLGLDEKAFDDFHRKFSQSKNDDDENNEEPNSFK